MASTKKRLEESCSLIDENLRRHIAEWKQDNTQKFRSELVEKLEEFVLRGGKRIRGFLVLLAYEMMGGEDKQKALDTATAVEIMHAFLLIHDDIMDSSDTRRNKKTLHKIYDDIYPGHGVNLGLVAGDTLLFFAYQLIDPDVLKLVNEMLMDTCFGQVTEYVSNITEDVNEETILGVYEMKTSRYSILMPLLAGAKLAKTEVDSVISDFALPLGIAYQIQDDLLDYSDDSGKDKYRDIREGKMTLVLYHAYNNANADQKAFLDSVFKKHVEDGWQLQKILHETGAFEYCERKIRKLADSSVSAVKNSHLSEDQKEMLLGIVDLLMKRKN